MFSEQLWYEQKSWQVGGGTGSRQRQRQKLFVALFIGLDGQ